MNELAPSAFWFTFDSLLIYMCIDQAWGQDGWILAEFFFFFFFAFLWTVTSQSSEKRKKKERCSYPAVLTERAVWVWYSENKKWLVYFEKRERNRSVEKDFCSSCHERGTEKKFWVPMRNRTSDLRIPRSDALPLSHRDSTVSERFITKFVWHASYILLGSAMSIVYCL